MRSLAISGLVGGLLAAAIVAAEPTLVPALLSKIKAVRKEGAGNAEAGKAWKALAAHGPDAVALAIKDAEALQTAGDKDKAVAAFRKALAGACDQDQVDTIAKQLKALGETVDLVSHFGLIRTWYLAAPFDNTDSAGFTRS